MATSYKVLGQSAPSATTDTTLYTVPANTETVVSTITVCNRSTSDAMTYRIAIRPAGASIANQHYIVYDISLAAKTTDTFTIGLTLSETDVITVRSSTANASFSAFGSEIS
jgi:hypothetical protein